MNKDLRTNRVQPSQVYSLRSVRLTPLQDQLLRTKKRRTASEKERTVTNWPIKWRSQQASGWN